MSPRASGCAHRGACPPIVEHRKHPRLSRPSRTLAQKTRRAPATTGWPQSARSPATSSISPSLTASPTPIASCPSRSKTLPQIHVRIFFPRRDGTGPCHPDQSTWTGRRDHLLFTLLYNTGARISEALQATPDDLRGRTLLLHGKGRKDRSVPLWTKTAAALRRWCRDNQIGPSQPMFINSNGVALSRHGARFRLKLTLTKAAAMCPDLRNRKLGLHSFRHTCAMHLLQSGVSIEVIALWLGHEQLVTTHGYIEADINMKEQTLQSLKEPKAVRRQKRKTPPGLITFLDSL
ncbi:hypothetical protein Ga0100230_011400 [Opitutaceae bacterium TAV3]|nr:hypothetical protein Ga0100230_011400 [Opitutaceae bacterium TAV3]